MESASSPPTLTNVAPASNRRARAAASGASGSGSGRKEVRRRRISPFWAKQLHLWHWMSSAICLIGMLLFAFTGITLNHAADIEAKPETLTAEAQLSAPLLEQMAAVEPDSGQPIPDAVRHWAARELSLDLSGRDVEWTDNEAYVALPRPGGDGWVAFNLDSGAVEYEITDRGWIAWLNDLHKGRDSGTAWSWFIDIFAAACIVFSITGFVLLWIHARHRRLTWPLVSAGLILPLLVIILFVHS